MAWSGGVPAPTGVWPSVMPFCYGPSRFGSLLIEGGLLVCHNGGGQRP